MGKDALFMNPIDESARLQRVAVIEWRMPWACDGEMRGTEWYLHAVLTDRKPVFGHHSGKRAQTHWLCFIK